ncbi:MAG: HNH endonuclease [Gemmatimonadetes bacterium]|nr:HNH endonuclease [Gemmatimonadota bacterium]
MTASGRPGGPGGGQRAGTRLRGRPWQRIRACILHRDGYVCVKCGRGDVLHVDHIDNDPSNNDPANLRTLCEGCNLARRKRRRKPEGPKREAWRRFAGY